MASNSTHLIDTIPKSHLTHVYWSVSTNPTKKPLENTLVRFQMHTDPISAIVKWLQLQVCKLHMTLEDAWLCFGKCHLPCHALVKSWICVPLQVSKLILQGWTAWCLRWYSLLLFHGDLALCDYWQLLHEFGRHWSRSHCPHQRFSSTGIAGMLCFFLFVLFVSFMDMFGLTWLHLSSCLHAFEELEMFALLQFPTEKMEVEWFGLACGSGCAFCSFYRTCILKSNVGLRWENSWVRLYGWRMVTWKHFCFNIIL